MQLVQLGLHNEFLADEMFFNFLAEEQFKSSPTRFINYSRREIAGAE